MELRFLKKITALWRQSCLDDTEGYDKIVRKNSTKSNDKSTDKSSDKSSNKSTDNQQTNLSDKRIKAISNL